MDSTQFLYWLQGFFEIAEPTTLNEKQIQIIKDHMKLAMTKVTPDRSVWPSLTEPITDDGWKRLQTEPGTGTPPWIHPLTINCSTSDNKPQNLFIATSDNNGLTLVKR